MLRGLGSSRCDVIILANQLVQLVIHVTADGGTVLFDLGDVSYRIIGIAIGGIVAVGYRTDQMGTCIGAAATGQIGIGFGQQNCTGGFENALRGEHRTTKRQCLSQGQRLNRWP